MPAGTFGSALGNPAEALGFLVQAQARVRVGKGNLYESLETTSDVYTNYTAPLGLVDAEAFDVGILADLSLNIEQTIEPFEAANQRQASIYFVTEESTTVGMGVTQFDRQMLELCLSTGVFIDLETANNPEYLITWGGGCDIKSRPIEIDVSNVSCYLESTQDADVGITGIRVTIYDALCTSGLPWENLNATEIGQLDLEFAARPVNAHSLGNLFGNMYIF